MEQLKSAIQSFIEDPIVSTELLMHCGGGYSKRLIVNTNVITKTVNFTVKDRIGKAATNYKTLESAMEGYSKIKPIE